MKSTVFLCLVQFICSLALAVSGHGPKVREGVLDLRQSDMENVSVDLAGEWRFSYDPLRPPDSAHRARTFLKMPGTWPVPTGYGTYSMDILLPEGQKSWALALPVIPSAYRLYANGELLSTMGQMGGSTAVIPQMRSTIVELLIPSDRLRLDLQVANFHFYAGGISTPLRMGYPETIRHINNRGIFMQALLIGALFFISIYHAFIFLSIRKDRGVLFFSIACFLMAVRGLFAGDALFFELFPQASFTFSLKLLYVIFPAALVSFMYYFRTILPAPVFSIFLQRTIEIGGVGYVMMVLLTPNTFHGRFLFLFALFFVWFVVYLLYRFFKTPLPAYENMLVVGGLLLLIVSVANDILNDIGVFHSWYLLPTGFFCFVLCQSLLLANRYSTALKEAGKLELEVAKNRFIANITHELKTPLTLVIGYAEQLKKGGGLSAYLLRPLNSIHHQSIKLLNLINQLLDLGRIEANAMPVQVFRTDVALLTESIVSSFEPHCNDKKLLLTVNCIDFSGNIAIDADKYERVVTNLLSNAVKFTDVGGEVSVVAKACPSFIELSVADTGIGIEANRRQHIFNRFYQVSDQSNGGSGIGLFLVKEILELLGGDIRVDSRPGKGTNFVVHFPIAEQPDAPLFDVTTFHVQHTDVLLPIVSPGHTEKRDATVLVVEDHEELRAFIAANLNPAYHVLQAADAEQGWAICQSELPDLVISDIMLPGVDGYELCRLIKQTSFCHHIAVMLLTAKSRSEHRIKGLSFEANDYLTKPFHVEELLLRIRNLLNHQLRLRDYYHRHLTTSSAMDDTTAPTDPFMASAYVKIEEELDNYRFSVEDLASHLAVSSRTLNRTMQKLTGFTTIDVIRKYRLKRSIGFLKSGHTVSETAYRVGFDSPSYFSKCFKEAFSCSPSTYSRAKH